MLGSFMFVVSCEVVSWFLSIVFVVFKRWSLLKGHLEICFVFWICFIRFIRSDSDN